MDKLEQIDEINKEIRSEQDKEMYYKRHLRRHVEMDRRDLEAMVQDVNAGEVLPEERLSDHVYMYDSREKELVLADRMEERKQQREQEQNQEKAEERAGRSDKADRTERKPERERVSMKELLSEKKAEVAKNEAGREHPVAKKTRETAR